MTEPEFQGGDAPAVLFSVIVPAYNEAERGLEARLDQLRDYLRATRAPYELIVVDDGSSDATPDILSRIASHSKPPVANGIPPPSPSEIVHNVRLEQNCGKGAAVKAGLMRASGDIVAFMDADLATPLDELPRLIAALDRGADIAIASRGLPESDLRQRESFVREWCGKLYNQLAQRIVVAGFKDTQCGFKVFRGPVARALAPAMSEPRFGFDVELVYLAVAAGFAVCEVPVRWEHQPGSRVRFIRDGWSMLAALLKIGWRRRLGRYRASLEQIRNRFAAETGPEAPIPAPASRLQSSRIGDDVDERCLESG